MAGSVKAKILEITLDGRTWCFLASLSETIVLESTLVQYHGTGTIELHHIRSLITMVLLGWLRNARISSSRILAGLFLLRNNEKSARRRLAKSDGV